MANIEIDIEDFYRKKCKLLAGVDEAGRGALAGPVVAAAVILPDNFLANDFGITDSKIINEKKREELFDIIQKNALAIGIGFVDNVEIDKINILQAAVKAMNLAINQLNPQPDFLIIDGNYFHGSMIEHKTIVKGDLLCPSISAASIIAKVSRDRWMRDIAAKEFPEYNFENHKGYAVKAHFKMIDNIGKCKYHRNSFLIKHETKLNTTLF